MFGRILVVGYRDFDDQRDDQKAATQTDVHRALKRPGNNYNVRRDRRLESKTRTVTINCQLARWAG